MYKHILLPTDGSKLSEKGVRQAIKVARALRAKITAVHVVGNYQPVLDQDEGFRPVIPAMRKAPAQRGAFSVAIRIRSPHKVILVNLRIRQTHCFYARSPIYGFQMYLAQRRNSSQPNMHSEGMLGAV